MEGFGVDPIPVPVRIVLVVQIVRSAAPYFLHQDRWLLIDVNREDGPEDFVEELPVGRD